MKKLFVLIIIPFIPALSFAQTKSANHTYWQQEVRYQIEATLDPATKRLEGYAVITYKNNSPDMLKRIYLQVPANAFFDEENTAVKEMQRFQGGSVRVIQEQDYQLTVQSVQFHQVGRESEFPLRAFNFHDTILDLPLPALLLPGDSLLMSVGYTQNYKPALADSASEERPRRRRERNRSPENFQIDFVHWYPRVAVYDRNGWNTEPFHFLMSAESVYSEFATIDATITVPGKYIIVSSGEVAAGDPGWQTVTMDTAMKKEKLIAWQDSVRKTLRQAGPRQVRFHADQALNFIWSASPAFLRAT